MKTRLNKTLLYLGLLALVLLICSNTWAADHTKAISKDSWYWYLGMKPQEKVTQSTNVYTTTQPSSSSDSEPYTAGGTEAIPIYDSEVDAVNYESLSVEIDTAGEIPTYESPVFVESPENYEIGLSNWGGWSPDQEYFDYLDGIQINWSRANFLDATSRIVKDVDEERAFCKNYCNEPLENGINCKDLQRGDKYNCSLKRPRSELFQNHSDYADIRLTLSKGFNLVGGLDIGAYRDDDSFRSFVSETVDYYKDEIKYWEIGNEVNIKEFWPGTPEKYGELIEIASNEINKVCPDCKVGMSFVHPGIAKDEVERQRWFNVIADSCDYFDFIDAHVLLAMREADLIDMRTAFTALDNVCPGKEFISTETSLQDNMGSLGGSREGQARGLIKMYSILFDMGYKKIFYRSMFDDPLYQGPDAGWAHDGLITKHPEHELKPAFYAFKTLTEKIGGFSSVERLTDSQYKFIVNNKDVYVLWCNSTPYSIPLNFVETPSLITLTDINGNVVLMPPTQDVILEAENAPKFLEVNYSPDIETVYYGTDGIYGYKFTGYDERIGRDKQTWVVWDGSQYGTQSGYGSFGKKVTIYGINSNGVQIAEATPDWGTGEDVTDYTTIFKTWTVITSPSSGDTREVTIELGEKPLFIEENYPPRRR